MTITCKVLRRFSKSTRTRLGLFALLLLAFMFTPNAQASGMVSVCDEAHFVAAVLGGGAVTFSCTGTIVLTRTVPIVADTQILGVYGRPLTFTQPLASSFSLFWVRSGRLDMFYVTLANATSSAILCAPGASLEVGQVTFSNNAAASSSGGGAIQNDQGAFVFVQLCTFIDNIADHGGAISSSSGLSGSPGYLWVEDSTFIGNFARGSGGAIYNNGSMFIDNSTLTHNAAGGNGGNIYNDIGATSVEILESTISEGLAEGGQGNNMFSGIPATIVADPFQFQPSASLVLRNSIMANPRGAGNCEGSVSNGGGNLQWPSSAYPCVGVVADPKLGPLASNYGPTQTMALLPGSAAIDKGLDSNCLVEPFDQRGILRPQGAHCDIGAYEVIPNITGAQAVLVSVVNNFQPLLPGAGAPKLTQQVIGPLTRSLDPSLWQADGNHLNPQHGEQVFDLHQTVVNNLSELIVDQTQLHYIENLLFVDRELAVAAITAANCGVIGAVAPSNGKCAQAASELANGDSSSAAGNYGEAVAHYQSAWRDATSPSAHN